MMENMPIIMTSDPSLIVNQPVDSPEWKELKQITTIYSQGSRQEMVKFYDGICKFMRLAQVAHAQSRNCFFDLSTMKEDTMNIIMHTTLHNFQAKMQEIMPNWYKFDWNINHKPVLDTSIMKNLFKYYMMNEDEADVDIDFIGCFGSPDCLKDLYSMSESTIAKVSRVIGLKKIFLSRMMYFSSDILKDHLEEHTEAYVQQEPSKLSKPLQKVELTPQQLIPPALLFQEPDEKQFRVGIRLTADERVEFIPLLEKFSQENNLEFYSKKKEYKKSLIVQDEKGETKFNQDVVTGDSDPEDEAKQTEKLTRYQTFRKWFTQKYNNGSRVIEDEDIDDGVAEDNGDQNGQVIQDDDSSIKEGGYDSIHEIDLEGGKAATNKEEGQNASNSTSFEEIETNGNQRSDDSEDGDEEKKTPNNPLQNYFENIIIYIHGGAFVSLSSSYMESFIRNMSNQTGAPVFSIDYRLAPTAQFPNNITDCITGYLWILQFVEKVVKVAPKKIVLIGDSAGASLCLSLQYWLIENNQRLPDLFLSCYGNMNLDTRLFTKSTFLAFREKLLHLSAMKTVQEFYIPEGVVIEGNYYLSPIKANSQLLGVLPKMRMYICMNDPLRDEQIIFARKLQKVQHDVQIHMFEEMEHGCLTLFNKNLPLAFVGRYQMINEIRALYYGEIIATPSEIVGKVMSSGEVNKEIKIKISDSILNEFY